MGANLGAAKGQRKSERASEAPLSERFICTRPALMSRDELVEPKRPLSWPTRFGPTQVASARTTFVAQTDLVSLFVCLFARQPASQPASQPGSVRLSLGAASLRQKLSRSPEASGGEFA